MASRPKARLLMEKGQRKLSICRKLSSDSAFAEPKTAWTSCFEQDPQDGIPPLRMRRSCCKEGEPAPVKTGFNLTEMMASLDESFGKVKSYTVVRTRGSLKRKSQETEGSSSDEEKCSCEKKSRFTRLRSLPVHLDAMNSPMGLELRQSPSEHTPVPRRSLRTLQRSHSALQLNNSPDVLRDELTGDKKRAKLLVSTPHDRKPEIDCISPGTLSDVVQGKYKEEIDRFDIVDCRYPFEYESGHVRGATNIYLPSELEARFLSNPVYPVPGGKRHILIFHCEFSSNRAPSMWQHLRELDRQINAENYPNLFYPEMYVVRGGYKDIHESQPHLCEPYGYTSMFDRGFKAERSRFTCLVKKNKSKKK